MHDDMTIPLRDGSLRYLDVIRIPIFNPDSSRKCMAVIGRDITNYKKIEEELRDSEVKYRKLFENMSNGVVIFDAETLRFEDVNTACLNLYGYTKEEFLNLTPLDVSAEVEKSRISVQKGLEREITHIPLRYHKKKDGTVFPLEIFAGTFFDKGRKKGIGVIVDLTERRKTEGKLRESEDTLKTILDSTTDAMFLVDTDGNILAMNETTARRLGKKKDEIIGTCVYDYLPSEIARTRKAYVEETIRSGKIVHFEDERNGECIDNSVYPIFDAQGKVIMVSIYGRYITAHKKAEEDLKKAYNLIKETQDASINIMEDLDRERNNLNALLKEREVLLREIHHRVKNNMQIIASMMRLQTRTISDRHYQEMFKDAVDRITVMSLIHEKLYRSKDFSKIAFRDYIKSLADEIFHSYGITEERIMLKIDVEILQIDIDKAITLGLIINELVTNAIKHAFPEGQTGEVNIILRKVSDNENELLVSDNGVGMPEDLDVRVTEGFGMQIVKVLTEDQLKARIEVKRDKGMEFRIRFKI